MVKHNKLNKKDNGLANICIYINNWLVQLSIEFENKFVESIDDGNRKKEPVFLLFFMEK